VISNLKHFLLAATACWRWMFGAFIISRKIVVLRRRAYLKYSRSLRAHFCESHSCSLGFTWWSVAGRDIGNSSCRPWGRSMSQDARLGWRCESRRGTAIWSRDRGRSSPGGTVRTIWAEKTQPRRRKDCDSPSLNFDSRQLAEGDRSIHARPPRCPAPAGHAHLSPARSGSVVRPDGRLSRRMPHYHSTGRCGSG
jgi:hypothetical protein